MAVPRVLRWLSQSVQSSGRGLLVTDGDNRGSAQSSVELGLCRCGREHPPSIGGFEPHIAVLRKPWHEQALAACLLVAVVVPSAFAVVVVAVEWWSSPAQRGWLLLGFGFYIVAALRAGSALLVRVCNRMLYLRVELRRFIAPTLFEAVTEALTKESERMGLTCSWDQEALQEVDKVTGEMTVRFRFWSSQSRELRICLTMDGLQDMAGKLDLHVQFLPGQDVVCGRDSRVERQEMLILSTRTSSEDALKDKALLLHWLQKCYQSYAQPEEGIVEVYALQETSVEWMPEWKFERVKPLKSSAGTGQSFFLDRGCLKKVLADARLWSGSSLRVYMILGPPGTGKSEFTIWLAGQLRLPVYRLCLSSPKLTDDRLAQLLSQSSVSHYSVLVQVDEFQGVVQRWLGSPYGADPMSGVTPGGFCECLQGATAMSRGVVVLTGTSDVGAEEVKRRLPAVFRRIHCASELGWMSGKDILIYFRQFLMRFVPGCPPEEWRYWEQRFVKDSGPWNGSRPISVDMLKQYLMQQITESSCLGFGSFNCSPFAPPREEGTDFFIHAERRKDFFERICESERSLQFLLGYAPVHQVQTIEFGY